MPIFMWYVSVGRYHQTADRLVVTDTISADWNKTFIRMSGKHLCLLYNLMLTWRLWKRSIVICAMVLCTVLLYFQFMCWWFRLVCDVFLSHHAMASMPVLHKAHKTTSDVHYVDFLFTRGPSTVWTRSSQFRCPTTARGSLRVATSTIWIATGCSIHRVRDHTVKAERRDVNDVILVTPNHFCVLTRSNRGRKERTHLSEQQESINVGENLWLPMNWSEITRQYRRPGNT